MKHRYNADWKISRDAAADLEESDSALVSRVVRVPFGKGRHVLDSRSHRVNVLHVAGDAVARVHVAECGVFPAGDKHREIFFRGSDHPRILRIDLIAAFERSVL